jgi:glutamate dehydrogenase/leucine dehydrogenase
VAGAANNQLWDLEDGDRLRERGILYVPDYVANAGGVIGGCAELLGWNDDVMKDRVERIYDTLLEVLRLAAEQGVPPHTAADRLVERRLKALKRGAREWM